MSVGQACGSVHSVGLYWNTSGAATAATARAVSRLLPQPVNTPAPLASMDPAGQLPATAWRSYALQPFSSTAEAKNNQAKEACSHYIESTKDA